MNPEEDAVEPVLLRADTATAARTPLPQERCREGTPWQSVLNQFSNAQGNFHCGTWESGEGCWSVAYTEDEFCHLIAGTIVLENGIGDVWRFEAGDSFVIPSGFRGSWRSIGNVRKFYALYEEPDALPP